MRESGLRQGCVARSYAVTHLRTRVTMKRRSAISVAIRTLLMVLCGFGFGIVTSAQQGVMRPSIEFTRVPFIDKGGVMTIGTIEGRVVGSRPDQRIVLYAKSGSWYVQPYDYQPFTKIEPDSSWISSTHLGTEYAALLVEPGYVPPNVADILPGLGGGVVAVKIVPATPFFWQTWWFRSISLLAALLGMLILFRWRQLRVIRALNLQFEQRLAERTRIAQDLHDTLLQGLLSASMQLHVANERLPLESPAKPLVGRVLELMGQVIEEGRHAVRGLRAPGRDMLEPENAFSRIRDELLLTQPVDYKVTVEGSSRQLRPIIRDEVYRVGHEALVNAFRHSRASRIELEMRYAPRYLKVLIRDNGIGIDPAVIQHGREGHWGLPGMRERANEIGGKLKVWSRISAGTEVELVIPGHIAYESSGTHRTWFARWNLWKTLFARNGDSEEDK